MRAMSHPRPLAGLPAADPRAVAREWLARRVAAAPLEAAPALASTAFVERAPALCRSLLAALGDDAALAALPGEGPALALLGGEEPFGSAGAGRAAAVEHLRGAAAQALLASTDPALHAALHDRLAHACSRLLAGALAGALAGEAAITVQDARRAGDPRGDLTAEAERLVVDGVPFALLAIEVEDAAVLPAGVLTVAEAAARTALPPGAVSAPDGPGSLLVLVRTGDGRRVAETLTRAVGGAASHHGAPLRAAAGVAEHPRDGDTPEELLAHADGQLFAARAEGLPLA